jgi:Lipocalin-like domain
MKLMTLVNRLAFALVLLVCPMLVAAEEPAPAEATGFLIIPIGLEVAGSSTDERPQAAASARSQFLGTWKLVSSEDKLKDGTVRPFKELGPHGVGYLMYAADGHMCAVLTNPDRPKWDDPPTAAQKTAAVEGLTAYCGRFEIDEVSHVMWHYPELAWRPDWVGTKQARPYRFDGDRLIFSGKAAEGSHGVDRWTIVWVKVK